nr:hypothetical protein CFP56_03846 [Quercus suber]
MGLRADVCDPIPSSSARAQSARTERKRPTQGRPPPLNAHHRSSATHHASSSRLHEPLHSLTSISGFEAVLDDIIGHHHWPYMQYGTHRWHGCAALAWTSVALPCRLQRTAASGSTIGNLPPLIRCSTNLSPPSTVQQAIRSFEVPSPSPSRSERPTAKHEAGRTAFRAYLFPYFPRHPSLLYLITSSSPLPFVARFTLGQRCCVFFTSLSVLLRRIPLSFVFSRGRF